MKKSVHILLALVIGMTACRTAPTATPSGGGTERAASFEEIENDVQGRDTQEVDFVPVAIDQVLPIGGQARTGESSRARLDLLPDATIIRLGPRTQFTLTELGSDAENPSTWLKLIAGQLWIILTGGELQVETEVGTASVRGSYMGVSYDPVTQTMTVTCLEGDCSLENDAGTTPLTNGEASEIIGADQPPSAAHPMSQDQYQEWRENSPESEQVPMPAGIPPKPEPTRVEFQAEDGQSLVGTYYPARVPDAPVVVLMHMMSFTQQDWVLLGLVDWLQNWPSAQGGALFAQTGSIYPPMPAGLSFAVFTFDYRGFGESTPPVLPDSMTGSEFDQWIAGWLLDSKAAYETARTLPGVDPARIAGIGASIGADGVVDACGEGCLGALSLSPGDYLNVPYPDVVASLDSAGKPVWCVAHELDGPSANACSSASGGLYRSIIYTEGGGEYGTHGMMFLFTDEAPPDIGQNILDWLMLVYGIAP